MSNSNPQNNQNSQDTQPRVETQRLYGLRDIDDGLWICIRECNGNCIVPNWNSVEKAEHYLYETCKPVAREIAQISPFLIGEFAQAVANAHRADQMELERMSIFPFGDLESFNDAAQKARDESPMVSNIPSAVMPVDEIPVPKKIDLSWLYGPVRLMAGGLIAAQCASHANWDGVATGIAIVLMWQGFNAMNAAHKACGDDE